MRFFFFFKLKSSEICYESWKLYFSVDRELQITVKKKNRQKKECFLFLVFRLLFTVTDNKRQMEPRAPPNWILSKRPTTTRSESKLPDLFGFSYEDWRKHIFAFVAFLCFLVFWKTLNPILEFKRTYETDTLSLSLCGLCVYLDKECSRTSCCVTYKKKPEDLKDEFTRYL